MRIIIAIQNRKKANRDWHERHDNKKRDPLYFLHDDEDDDDNEE